MAKINISFDNIDYTIDEESFSAASAELKSHLSNIMNGSGAVINLDGLSYNVDSVKLSNATTDFVSHLGTISGSGSKVVIGNVEYGISSTKIQDAISDLHGTFDELKVKEEPITFATASWEKIAEISESGRAAEYFAIGDTRDVSFGDETIRFAIVAFDHDELSDGTGKAGITVIAQTLCSDWTIMTNGASNSGGWASCSARTYLHDTLLPKASAELQAVIKTVNKKYGYWNNASAGSFYGSKTSKDKLWYLSHTEAGLYDESMYYYAALGSRYKNFSPSIIGSGNAFWLRNVYGGLEGATSKKTSHFLRCIYDSNGIHMGSAAGNDFATTPRTNMLFGFCI